MSAIHEVGYPFVRCTVDVFDGEGGYTTIQSWKPGVEMRGILPYGEGGEEYADDIGFMVLTEVSRHKPGKYPERIFYTRSWITPDGVPFGKPGLRVAVKSKFDRLRKGYAHPFRVEDKGVAA